MIITYNIEVLKCRLCDYNDAYILVRGDIIIAGRNLATEVAFKDCGALIKCIAKNWWNDDRWCWKFRFGHDNALFNRM